MFHPSAIPPSFSCRKINMVELTIYKELPLIYESMKVAEPSIGCSPSNLDK